MTSTLPADSPRRGSTIHSVAVSGGALPALEIAGSGASPFSASLVGARQRLGGSVSGGATGWSIAIPLVGPRWRGPVLPAVSGRYRLELAGADGAPVAAELPSELPENHLAAGLFRIAVTSAGRTLDVAISAPLADDELGAANQAALESGYRAARYTPLNAVFFESFYGQSAACNPLAIDRELAATRPDVTRYWSVVDASVEVPEGSIALIEGSAEWWRIRGSARLLVVNDWLRNRYRKRRHQTVLQTWHGTPLKKIALSRPGIGLRTALATIRERSRWSILLSQNKHSSSVFRSAYAFLGPIWQEGYPRDDALTTGDAASVRARLGLADDVTVVLYAPTWRDDHPEQTDYLDVAAFTDALGPGYVTLIRGHSRSLRPGRDVEAGNVVDVTSYADVAELFLVADVLVTDYSSVMFDFSVTGKPMFFFAPDLEHYREQLRGFYFDLEALAPGPVVQQPAQLVDLVLDRDEVVRRYADKYSAWRAEFNPRDDGGSAARVVARLLQRGAIG